MLCIAVHQLMKKIKILKCLKKGISCPNCYKMTTIKQKKVLKREINKSR